MKLNPQTNASVTSQVIAMREPPIGIHRNEREPPIGIHRNEREPPIGTYRNERKPPIGISQTRHLDITGLIMTHHERTRFLIFLWDFKLGIEISDFLWTGAT